MARQPQRRHVGLNGVDSLALGAAEDVIHREADDELATIEITDTEGESWRWSFRAPTNERALNATIIDKPPDYKGAIAEAPPRFTYSFLFDWTCPIRRDHDIDHDVVSQLMQFVDRADDFDDSELTGYDAEFNGESQFAPAVVWAHTSSRDGHRIAVLPLPLGDAPTGRVPVTVGDTTLTIFFVAGESEHVAFFRSVVALENADEAKFQRLAKSAFPALGWADNVWRGLTHFDRPYIEVRDELVHCLGGLNDHGAACFHEFQPDPRRLAQVLSARTGKATSDENGRTKRHSPSRRDRTRRHGGCVLPD